MRNKCLLANSVVIPTLICVLIPVTSARAQDKDSRLVRLFKLDGTFSSELPLKTNSEPKSKPPGVRLTGARLEADSLGFLTRLRAMLTIANDDPARRITGVEWRLDVFDASLRSVSARVLQTDKVNIYSGESAVASAKFGGVLPDRMVVLLQLVRVSFADSSVWSSTEECSLGEDLRTVSCKR
jgi:hypothetical protein